MRSVKVSAPGKLMLFGEHAVIFRRPCIVTAIDQRMTLIAVPNEENKVRINAPDIGIVGYQNDLDSLGVIGTGPKGVKFVETAMRVFKEELDLPFGVDIRTESEFDASGLGSSSASTVCTIKALSELTGNNLTEKELFDLSYKTILEVQGEGSGFDTAAAIWGGTLYYLYGGEEISSIGVNGIPITVGHSNVKAETPLMIRKVKDMYDDRREVMDHVFDLMGNVADKARSSLEEEDNKGFGELADINQGLLEAIGVSSLELSRLIHATRKAGAYGAKLSGAGGGDCMFAIAPESKRNGIEKAIEENGGRLIYVNTNAEGVRVEK